MSDKVSGYLEVGQNEAGEVVINHPNPDTDENGVGHLVFSPNQARGLARLLMKHAGDIDRKRRVSQPPETSRARRSVTAVSLGSDLVGLGVVPRGTRAATIRIEVGMPVEITAEYFPDDAVLSADWTVLSEPAAGADGVAISSHEGAEVATLSRSSETENQ